MLILEFITGSDGHKEQKYSQYLHFRFDFVLELAAKRQRNDIKWYNVFVSVIYLENLEKDEKCLLSIVNVGIDCNKDKLVSLLLSQLFLLLRVSVSYKDKTPVGRGGHLTETWVGWCRWGLQPC